MAITRRKAIALLSTSMVAASGFSSFSLAVAQPGAQPPAELVALVETVLKAYSSKDLALLKSVYGGNLVIIDGFGRFRWTGPNAMDEWWADVEQFFKDVDVASEELTSQGIRAWGVNGDRGYVSVSATLTIKRNKGEPIIRPGVLTFTLAKLSNVWKAEGHAWGRLN